jgi:hypothetical protein
VDRFDAQGLDPLKADRYPWDACEVHGAILEGSCMRGQDLAKE